MSGSRLREFLLKQANTDSATVRLRALRGSPEGLVRVNAPGLDVSPSEIAVPGEATLKVPADTYPGNYAVSISGPHVIGIKRFQAVE